MKTQYFLSPQQGAKIKILSIVEKNDQYFRPQKALAYY